ncbi:MAG: hypothetical protein GYA23_09705 [Methanomicrobiales archaeon]|nr:hypothetical protein [Methanomicrobiales archaeon]
MTLTQRHYIIMVVFTLLAAIVASGCTASTGSDSDMATADPAMPGSADTEFHSTFEEIAGVYANPDNGDRITLYRDGAARVQTGSSKTDTSVYMEMGVLYLADGTSIGSYPIMDGTLTYQGIKYVKK